MSSSDTASKQGPEGSGVIQNEIGDPNFKSGADTKAEVLTMPGGDPVISSEEDDPVSTALEHEEAHYIPRGPPSRPVYSGGRPIIRR